MYLSLLAQMEDKYPPAAPKGPRISRRRYARDRRRHERLAMIRRLSFGRRSARAATSDCAARA